MSKSQDTNLSSVEAQLRDLVKGQITPAPAEFDTVEILVSLNSNVFRAWFEDYVYSVEAVVATQGGNIPGFNAVDFMRYLNTILYSRVAYVRNEPVFLRWGDLVCVPAFFSVAIAKIGRAVNNSLGLELVPKVQFTPEQLMTQDEVWAFSRRLELLERFGFTMGYGYLRNKEGDYHVMSFFHTETNVYSPNDQAPESFSVLASFLSTTGIEAVLAPRVNYGQTRYLAALVRKLARPSKEA